MQNTSAAALLTVSRIQSAALLALNRPEKRNALSGALLEELSLAIDAAANDPSTRVIVLTGGDTCFSSGADLDEVIEIKEIAAASEQLLRFRLVTDAIESCRVPVIAAINGACMTGGLEIALACDLRVADDRASFAVTSARIGGLPGAGGTQRLPRLIGASRAKQLMLLGFPVRADIALDIGLVNEVCPAGTAVPRALELAQQISARAPLSVSLIKRAVNDGADLPMPAALDLELELASTIFQTADHDEGIRAFKEHREPRFLGR
jgi:enoyl-CoA hydratase/carnithine racemase